MTILFVNDGVVPVNPDIVSDFGPVSRTLHSPPPQQPNKLPHVLQNGGRGHESCGLNIN